MLFMTMFRWEPGKTDKVMQLRKTMSIPPGIKVVKEWVALETNLVFRLEEITDPAALLRESGSWIDLGHTEMHPVMETEEVFDLLK